MTDDPRRWMWAEACALLARAEHMHRQFFEPAPEAAAWEPPVDIFETASGLEVLVALPGVRPDDLQIVIDGGDLIVVGRRPLPPEVRSATIRRIEIPFGRFERRIPLPVASWRLVRHELADGCLVLALHRQA